MYKTEIEYFGKKLSLETGKLAKQANGSVTVKYGNTMVLVSATAATSNKNTLGYFPLTCVYQFKNFAMGKIPGGFFKREAKPSDNEVLISRMIDRPIRPLFPKEYQAETQIIASVLSYEEDSPPEVAAILGASAALAISDIPFKKQLAAAVVGFDGENFTLNQGSTKISEGKLNLLMVATEDALVMVESEAKQLPEETFLKALEFGKKAVLPLIELQKKLVSQVNPQKISVEVTTLPDEIGDKVKDFATERLKQALEIKTKKERYKELASVKEKVAENFAAEYEQHADLISELIGDTTSQIIRENIIKNQKRVDGRKPEDIREISCESGVLPNAHGSALFTRGETQALVVATLGTKDDEQFIDSPPAGFYKKFFLHYNFPSFSVGEVKRLGPPGRREIGHGRLAERSLAAVMPEHSKFPYTVRIVSEILESNGSSSMATICGSSLALADCDVKLSAPVAGIAMGLVFDEQNPVILSDILGDEDHVGDMDFKVAGTDKGITGLQMDIKIDGLSDDLFFKALMQAKDGRMHILNEMKKVIKHAKNPLSNTIPKFLQIKIPTSKIRVLIGAGGQTIKSITAKSGAKIDIKDNGVVNVAASDQKNAEMAVSLIKQTIGELQIGSTYKGLIKKRIGVGFFVECIPGIDGMVPVSEFDNPDAYKEGDRLDVTVVGYDRQNRLRLGITKT